MTNEARFKRLNGTQSTYRTMCMVEGCGWTAIYDNGWNYYRNPRTMELNHLRSVHKFALIDEDWTAKDGYYVYEARPMNQWELEMVETIKKSNRRRSRPRDAQRSRTYRAEGSTAYRLREDVSRTVEPIKALRRATRLKAIERRLGKLKLPKVAVYEATMTRYAGRAFTRRNKIHFNTPRPSMDLLLHELAHLYAHKLFPLAPAHGREFRWVYLTLVRYAVSKGAYEALRDSFKAQRLTYTKPKGK